MKIPVATTILIWLVALLRRCVADCWCTRSNSDPDDSCPDIGKRTDVYDHTGDTNPKISFFNSIAPKEDGLYKLDPPGCQPFPSVASVLNETSCTGVARADGKEDTEDGDLQCRLRYHRNICRNGVYSLKTRKARRNNKTGRFLRKQNGRKGKRQKWRGSVTHAGSCGVCSSAQDLAAYLSRSFLQDTHSCSYSVDNDIENQVFDPTILSNAVSCYKALGFSDDCSFVWASGAIATALEVNDAAASLVPGAAPYTGPESCLVCAQECVPKATATSGRCHSPWYPWPCGFCREDAIDPIFLKFAGRSRQNSGIVAHGDPKRSCSSTPDIGQPYVECPTVAPGPTPNPTPFDPLAPTKNPTQKPTKYPTQKPSKRPTNRPTFAPPGTPTAGPKDPIPKPTPFDPLAPTPNPTGQPTKHPTRKPTNYPTNSFPDGPTPKPTPFDPLAPTPSPTREPTRYPTRKPTSAPNAF